MRGMRALPLDDRSVDALPDEARRAISRHWERRAVSELKVARSFGLLAPWVKRLSTEPVVVALMERAADDEERHAEICRVLAERYGGVKVAGPTVEDLALPSFGCEDERLEVALHVAGMCCINETIATAWIEACLACAEVPLAVAANRAHLREEIDHARVGWAYLASRAITPSLREELGACVPRLLEANVPQWERADPDLPAEGVRMHGHPSEEASRRAVQDAVRELVLPGFRHVGIEVRGQG